MALKANETKNKGNESFPPQEPIDIGAYPARLVAVVDLGLQAQKPYQGKEKEPVYQIQTTYELLDEFMKDEDGNDVEDKPKLLSERFALYSLDAEKAKSTKRYLALDPNNVNDSDWVALLGMPCIVTVVHNPNTKDPKRGPYVNIGNVSAMRLKDAEKAGPLVNQPLAFNLDSPDIEVFNKLPQWVQKVIQGNLEYEGSELEKLLKAQPKEKAESKAEVTENEEDLEKENPYD
jgi:hypothetical protein